MTGLQQERIQQARESLEEARAVRSAGMDVGFVLNNLFLAFYYPVIALVHKGRVPDAMQSVTIGLFDQQYIRTGKIEQTFLDAISRMFELKPRCSSGCPPVSPDEIDRLAAQAGSFIARVDDLLTGRP